MEKIIQLQNRDGDKNYLEFLHKGRDLQHLVWYKLNLENNFVIRTGYSKPTYSDRYITFIDHPGGPFMGIGKFKVGDLLLKKVKFKDGVKLGFVVDK